MHTQALLAFKASPPPPLHLQLDWRLVSAAAACLPALVILLSSPAPTCLCMPFSLPYYLHATTCLPTCLLYSPAGIPSLTYSCHYHARLPTSLGLLPAYYYHRAVDLCLLCLPSLPSAAPLFLLRFFDSPSHYLPSLCLTFWVFEYYRPCCYTWCCGGQMDVSHLWDRSHGVVPSFAFYTLPTCLTFLPSTPPSYYLPACSPVWGTFGW